MTISLAFLAPDLVKAAIDGRLPQGILASPTCPPNGASTVAAPHSNQSLLGAVSVAGKRNFEARDDGAEISLGSRCRHSQRPSAPRASPSIRRSSPKAGKSPLECDCVVGLRGLELRAKHAVAIEPISGERPTAAILRSNVAESGQIIWKGLAFGHHQSGTVGQFQAPRAVIFGPTTQRFFVLEIGRKVAKISSRPRNDDGCGETCWREVLFIS